MTSEYKVVAVRETGPKMRCNGPEKIVEYYGRIRDDIHYFMDREQVHTIMLDARLDVIGHSLVSVGTVDSSIVHPREVYRAATIANAVAIVLIHNHPSGDPTPSAYDIKLTREIIRAGKIIRIECMDHIIYATNKSVSMKELGYFS